MNATYAVRNKKTGELFAGFDVNQKPQWTVDESKAFAYVSKNDAYGQALLFNSFGIKAQQKPVAL
jgi:hypothetical protein